MAPNDPRYTRCATNIPAAKRPKNIQSKQPEPSFPTPPIYQPRSHGANSFLRAPRGATAESHIHGDFQNITTSYKGGIQDTKRNQKRKENPNERHTDHAWRANKSPNMYHMCGANCNSITWCLTFVFNHEFSLSDINH